MIWGDLALVSAALFTSAALYVSAVEHPARRALTPSAALSHWRPAYARGKVMQGALALLGTACGVAAWLAVGGVVWLAGALLLFANWPFTLAVIMPVNHRLEAIDPAAAGPDATELLERWARLHAVRTMLGAVATLVMLWSARG